MKPFQFYLRLGQPKPQCSYPTPLTHGSSWAALPTMAGSSWLVVFDFWRVKRQAGGMVRESWVADAYLRNLGTE